MKPLLLRFFPARWRARYGDEFEALLAERPLGPFDVADVLLAAFDAHLHRHGLSAVPHPTGGFTMNPRIGGYAAIVGGALWLFGLTYATVGAAAGSDATGPMALLILLVANASLIVALAGLSAFQARRYPRWIWVACAVPTVGAVVAILGLLASAFIGDRPVIGGYSWWLVWMLGILTLVIGSAIFAGVTWRTAALPRPAVALLASGVAGVVPFLAEVANGSTSEPVFNLLVVGSLFLFAAGWVAVGWSALRLDRGAVAPTGAA